MSKFQHVPKATKDPIYSLITLYNNDPNPNKVQAGVGYYHDEDGKPWILPSIQMADNVINQNRQKYNHEYSPQPGFPQFLKACKEILLPNSQLLSSDRLISVQAVSGTGSLYVIFEFLHAFYKNHQVFIADQTWVVHKGIYKRVYGDVPHSTYRYQYQDSEVDFGNIYQCLATEAPEGSVILMQSCSHNPTGIDPSHQQWQELADIFKKRNHIAVFDVAAQGFASGSLEEDAYAVKLFGESGVECMIAQSFSKTCGIYGDRVGCVHVIHNGDQHQSKCIYDQLVKITRQTWSLNPSYGAQLISVIGENQEIRKQLDEDIKTMFKRTEKMRQLLYSEMVRQKVPGSWLNVKYSKGLFVFLNFTDEQTEYLKDKYSVYASKNGRLSVSQLLQKDIEYLVTAIKETLEYVK